MTATRKSATKAPSRRKSPRSERTPLFPPAVHAFAARRVVDASGLVLLGLGVATAIALASYSIADPSLNTAVSEDAPLQVQNLLGLPGAYLADILTQTLGLAGWVFAMVFSVWGYRVLRRRPMGRWSARIPALLGAVICTALMLARVPAFEGWQLGSYLGGSAGTLVFNALGGTLQGIIGDAAHLALAGAAGLAGAGFSVLALGITRDEWARAGALSAAITATTLRITANGLIGFRNWVAHHAGQEPVALAPAPEPQLATDEVPQAAKRSQPQIAVPQKTTDVPNDKQGIVTPRAKKLKQGKRAEAEKQPTLALSDNGEWELPPLSLLQEADPSKIGNHDEQALQRNAEMLQSVLEDFGVKGDIVKVHPGPVVTLYELEPAPGIKTSRVIGLSDDIARSMSAVSVRAAVVPGRNVIGIELPNAEREFVYLRELLSSKVFENTKAALPMILGKDIGGHPIIADLARMPHLLVAGTTGSGKSVAVNTMIVSLLYRHPPEKCRFIMIDPKMLELSVYDDIPHLLTPVVTDPGKAVVALKWTVREMEERYRAMSKMGVRNIEGYNARLREARKKGEVIMRKIQTGFDSDTGKPVFEEQPLDLTELPYIVVVVDEFADLMLVAGKDVEGAIQRLAQMARAAGIHLIMATQRPSVDVITGTIKANFPTRISFQVTSKIDSRTILGEGGAEHLLGMGDMLYMASGGRIKRVHGPFVADEEVEHVVTHLKEQGEPQYLDDVTEGDAEDFAFPGMPGGDGEGSGDELYDKAVHLVLSERKASTSFVQRHMSIGYNRAAKLIDRMEKEGVIGPANHVGKREILVGDMVGG